MAKQMYYEHLKGKEIKIVFTDGKAIKGTLLTAKQYEFILKVEDKEVVIMKHAVKYLHEQLQYSQK